MRPAAVAYTLDGQTARRVLAELAAARRMRFHPARERAFSIYDTFDGRLSRGGKTLLGVHEEDQERLLFEPGAGLAPLELVLPRAPAFAAELPPGPLRVELERASSVRRLLPVCDVERRARPLDVLDRDEKTVARLTIEQGRAREARGRSQQADTPPWTELPQRLRVEPLRGYEREFEELVQLLETQGLQRAAGGDADFVAGVLGLRLGLDPSALRLTLAPDVPAAVGMKCVHRELLDIVLANEDGVRADLDPEFLHDYRVAVRRTRTLLAQVKDVFDPDALSFFRPELGWLGGLTGPCRDLDVLRMALDEHGDESLGPLARLLERKHQRAHAELVGELSQERYAALMRGWAAFLAQPPGRGDGAPPNAERPLRDVLSERLARLYKRVRRQRDRELEPTEMHALRLDCKKLRYLIDCTPGVFRTEDSARVVGRLKKLQDSLGEFNDCRVQQVTLRSCAETLAEHTPPVVTLLALGRWIERLERDAEEARARAMERLAEFTAGPFKKSFKALLRSAEHEPPGGDA
jgi:CHAD domain-containing protein